MKVIKHDIHSCDEANKALEEALKKLKAETDSQLFVNIKRDAKKSLDMGESVIISVTEHLGQETVHFTVDESLEEWIGSLSTIGKFDHDQTAYKGALFGKYDLDQKNDTDHDEYVFNGSLNLPNGKTIFTDWNNKRLKLIDKSYNLMSHCDVPGNPYSVCYINDNMVAATLRDEKLVQFVNVADTKLTLDERFKIDEYCRGIAYKSDQLYITVGGGEGEIHGQLRVYSMHGGLLRIYEEDVQGKPFFTSPGFIVINDDGSRVHVTDHKKGVVTITKDGRLASVFHDKCLKNPLGLCMDGKGNLFVSGRDSSNVIQFTADGRKIAEVLSETDGITQPLAICCHESINTRLIISMENSFTVKVFTLLEK
jgi:sugar lactone lactonase YvrE